MTVDPQKLYKNTLLSLLAGFLLSIFILAPVPSSAAIAKLINFQGKLTKTADGTNVADGNYSVQFKIYDAATSGNLLWTETWDGTGGTAQVNFTNGVFSVKLGTYKDLSTVDFTTGALYLTVNVNITGSYDGEMLPRKQLVSAPYAFNASNLVGTGRISITSTSSTSSAASITYNPDSATATPAVIITASSNVTGPALKVVQSGSGAAALFTGGNVGIGTTAPASTLFIQGSGAVNPFVVASSSGSQLLTVLQNGNVGINTSSPLSRLAVVGDAFIVGSTTITNLNQALPVRSLASGDLINGAIVLGSTDVSGVLAVANGGTGQSILTANYILFGNGTNGVSTSSQLYYQNSILDASTSVITNLTSNNATITQLSLNGIAYTWPLTQGASSTVLTTNGAGLLSWGTASGALSGGTVGRLAVWSSPSTLTTGLLLDGGSTETAGINATSSTITFNLQSNAGTFDPFNVASSSTTSFLRVTQAGNVGINTSSPLSRFAVVGDAFIVGSTTITNLNQALPVRSLASGALVNGAINVSGTDITGILPIANGGTNSSTLGSTLVGFVSNDTNIQGSIANNALSLAWAGTLSVARGGTGSSTLPTVQGQILADNGSHSYGPTTLVAGTNVTITTTTPGFITIAASSGGLSGGIAGRLAVWSSPSSLTTGLFLDGGSIETAGINATSSTVTFNLQGSAGTFDPFNVASSSGASYLKVLQGGNIGINTSSPLSKLSVVGDAFIVGSTTVTNLNSALPVRSLASGALVNGAVGLGSTDVSGLLPVANGGTGQSILTANYILFGNGTNGLASSSQFYYQNNTLNASTTFSTNLTAVSATSTNFAITGVSNCNILNSTSAGSVGCNNTAYDTGSGTTGFSAIWSGANALGTGRVIDNGTVAGLGATSSTISLNIQGNAGTFDPFNVASSSGTSYLKVLQGGNVGIGSSSPTALLTLQGSSGSTAKLFSIASSTGAQMFTVQSNSTVDMVNLAAPTGLSLTGASTVFPGSLAAGTYYLKVVALDSGFGTTTASNEANITVSAGSKFTASWNPVAGANKYAVFFGTSPGNETSYFYAAGSATSTTISTTTVGQLIGTIPTVNTAYNIGFNPVGTSWFDGGNLAVGSGALVVGPGISSVSSSSQFTVLAGPGTISRVSQSNLANASQPDAIYVQGRYAYIAEGDGTTNAFEIFDVSNPSAPIRTSQNNLAQGNTNGGGDSIYVQGHYAYIAEGSGTSSAFEIFDVSNPSAPTRLSQSNLAFGANGASADAIYIQGRYAYIVEGAGTSKAFEIFDVSQPAFPVRISQTDTPNNAGDAIVVQGRYAYIDEGSSFAHSFSIYDVSNPYAPFLVSQADKTAFDGESLYVQGRYAYSVSGGQAGDAGFDIFDISNPNATPTLVSATLMGDPNPIGGSTTFTISVQGRYAYIAEVGGVAALQVFDVSNPAAPMSVNEVPLNYNEGGGSPGRGGVGMFVQGRYAYVAEGGGTTNAFEIFDIGGAYIQQLETGGIETGSLSVRNDIYGFNESLGGGLTVGASLLVNGTGDIVSASTTNNTTASIFSVSTAASSVDTLVVLGNGKVGIGTGTPANNLTVIGSISSSNLTNGTCVQAGPGGVLTSTGSACGISSGTGNSAWTIGAALIYNATSTDSVLVGTTTPTAQKFVIQGSGSKDLLNIASSSGASYFYITSTGNVGLGTTTPTAKFALQGTSGQTADLLNIASSTGASMLKVSAWGGLGIQTTSSSALSVLDLSGNSVFNVDSSNATGNSGIDITAGSAQTGMLLNIASSSGTTMLQVTSAGSFIQNVSSTTAFSIQNGSGTSVFAVNSTAGNVGIGTSSPTQTLAVVGTANFLTSTNNALAFQVQNASATPVFVVDTTVNANLVSNPGFETGTTGWSASGTNSSIARVTLHKFFGIASLQINTPATATTGAFTTLFTTPLATSTQYTLSFYARVDTASSSFSTLVAGWANAGTTVTACALNSTTVVNSGWTRYFCTFTTGNISGTPNIFIGHSDAVTRNFYIDSVQLQTGASYTPYQVGGIQLRGIITNPVTLSAVSNSVNAFQIQDSAGTANLFIADTLNGRVGIGTSTPAARLAIVGLGGSNNLLDIASSSGASFMRVTFNGRVGLGSTTPNATLSIRTQAGVDPFIVASSTGATSTYFSITAAAGNVGVGTGTPLARFVVAANCFNFASTTLANSTGKCTDYAEIYPSSEAVNMGEIVSSGLAANVTAQNGLIKKTVAPYDPHILGIVSTNPAAVVEGNSVQLMNGSDYHHDPYRPAIALAGRVPLKIKADTVIHMGDFITSSEIPGLGMKAQHSGQVIGQALEEFDPVANNNSEPQILVFVKPGYQVIGNPLDLSVLTSSSGLDLSNAQTASRDILSKLFVNISATISSLSYITTDRLISGLDVTTQQLTSKSLNVDNIYPGLGTSVNVSLPADGHLTIGASGQPAGLSFDALGNATVAGSLSAATATVESLVAGHILSPDLLSLNQALAGLSLQASSTQAQVTNLEQQFNSFASSTVGTLANLQASLNATSTSINLQDLAKAQDLGLTFSGPVKFAGGISVNTLAGLDNGGISVNGDVYFLGRPYFTTDTAGFAVINAGDAQVDVTFARDYLEQPIVNTSISANSTSTAGALDLFAQNVFANNIQYIITNKSEHGFSILLNKPAPTAIQFSWIALAVKDAKTFSSITPQAQAIAQGGQSLSLPGQLASSTPSVLAATTTPEVLGTSTPATDSASSPPNVLATSSPDQTSTLANSPPADSPNPTASSSP